MGGQEVSGPRRWPFRPDKTDLQVSKHAEAAPRGDDIIRDGSDFKSGTDRVAQYLLESIDHGGSLPPLSLRFCEKVELFFLFLTSESGEEDFPVKKKRSDPTC